MTPVFVDSSYYVALLLKTDQAHTRAVEITRKLESPIDDCLGAYGSG